MDKKEKMSDEELTWEEVSCQHLVQDEWIDFRRSAYRFPDGSQYEPFYSYSRRDFVVIVAVDEAGKLICVRQYRQGLSQVTMEFCAGGIERFDGKGYRVGEDSKADEANREQALEAAKRELMEETGYASEEWTHLLTEPSNATIADNYAYLFFAKNCKKAGEQHLDDMEFLNVELVEPQELEKLIYSGKFQQAIHALAWFMVKDKGLL